MRPFALLAAILLTTAMAAPAHAQDDGFGGLGDDDPALAPWTTGWIGIEVQDSAALAPRIRRAAGMEIPDGLLVTSVERYSPAEYAGLRRNDVITAWNGVPTASVSAFGERVRDTTVGTVVPVRVWRAGSERTVNVEVGEYRVHLDRLVVPFVVNYEKTNYATQFNLVMGMVRWESSDYETHVDVLWRFIAYDRVAGERTMTLLWVLPLPVGGDSETMRRELPQRVRF